MYRPPQHALDHALIHYLSVHARLIRETPATLLQDPQPAGYMRRLIEIYAAAGQGLLSYADHVTSSRPGTTPPAVHGQQRAQATGPGSLPADAPANADAANDLITQAAMITVAAVTGETWY